DTVTELVAVAVAPFCVTFSVMVCGPSLNFVVLHPIHIALLTIDSDASVVPSTWTVICFDCPDTAVVLTPMVRLPLTVEPAAGDVMVAVNGAVGGSGAAVVFDTVTDRVAVPLPPA